MRNQAESTCAPPNSAVFDGQDEKPSRVSTSGRSIEECRGEVEMDRMRNQAECQPVGEVSKNVAGEVEMDRMRNQAECQPRFRDRSMKNVGRLRWTG